MAKRLLTATVGIPAVLLVIAFGGRNGFLILILVVVAVALREFLNMSLPEDEVGGKWLGTMLGCLQVVAVYLDAYVFPGGSAALAATGCCVMNLLVLCFYYLICATSTARAFHHIAVTIFGLLYVAFMFSYAILLRSAAEGVSLIFFLLFVTWAGDSGAYAIGSWKGKRLLCQSISPHKTVEGAAGSAVAGVAAAVLCTLLLFRHIGLGHGLVLGIGINIMNQIGDLSESLIKRACNVKDSGSLLPGHGGMLDRVDSLFFAAPFLFYYSAIILHP